MSNRREFIKKTSYIGLGIVAGILPGLVTSCSDSTSVNDSQSDVDIPLDGYPGLANINGFAKIKIANKNDDKPVIIIRTGEASFIVLSSICGHQECVVDDPDIESQSISCPCHGSKYTLTGGIINGPTTRPLKNIAYSYNQMKNILTITI
jgi:Rieske Fe-S protein